MQLSASSILEMTQQHVFAHEGVAECLTLVGQKVDACSLFLCWGETALCNNSQPLTPHGPEKALKTFTTAIMLPPSLTPTHARLAHLFASDAQYSTIIPQNPPHYQMANSTHWGIEPGNL